MVGTQRETVTKGFVHMCIHDHGKRIRVCPPLSQEFPRSWSEAIMSQYSAELFRIDLACSFSAV